MQEDIKWTQRDLQLIEFLPLDDEGDGDADDYHTEKDENED